MWPVFFFILLNLKHLTMFQNEVDTIGKGKQSIHSMSFLSLKRSPVARNPDFVVCEQQMGKPACAFM